MTAKDRDNNRILAERQQEIDAIATAKGLQAAIDYANTLIDTSAGIVGGDGSYWSRDTFPTESTPAGR